MFNFLNTSVFLPILKKELLVIKRCYKGRLLDMSIMLAINVVIFTYFTPQLNVGGLAMLAGSIATFGFFRVVDKASIIIADLDGDRRITYDLTYPLPSVVIFSSIALSSAMETALLLFPLFFLGKLLLLGAWDLSVTSWWRLAIIYCTINLFFGFFGLWIASRIRNMNEIAHLWVRFVAPLYSFSTFFYTWETANAMSPIVGMITLCNPLVYAVEGMRSALCGPEGYLPFYLCVLVLLGITVIFALHGCFSMKKRLDAI